MPGAGLRGLAALVGFLWRRKFVLGTGVFGFAFVISVVWWQFNLSIGKIPLTVWVAIAAGIVTLPYAVMISALLVGLMVDPDRVILHEVDAADGDAAVHEISPETYNELICVDATGKEIGKGHLQQIDVLYAQKAFEVNTYDPEANVAEVSWMGEASNIQIRRHERMLEQVQETLSPMARAYSDLHTTYDMDVREKAQNVFNSMMAQVEGVELPPGLSISSQLQQDAGQEELERLPDPEEELHELEEPARREGGPPMEDVERVNTPADSGGDQR